MSYREEDDKNKRRKGINGSILPGDLISQ